MGTSLGGVACRSSAWRAFAAPRNIFIRLSIDQCDVAHTLGKNLGCDGGASVWPEVAAASSHMRTTSFINLSRYRLRAHTIAEFFSSPLIGDRAGWIPPQGADPR